jgi:hypothetical protein
MRVFMRIDCLVVRKKSDFDLTTSTLKELTEITGKVQVLPSEPATFIEKFPKSVDLNLQLFKVLLLLNARFDSTTQLKGI